VRLSRKINVSCEFGACGNSFVPGCTTCGDHDTTISGVINIGVAWDAVWGGAVGVAKYAGCGILGAGKSVQSFLGVNPSWASNGPPGPSSVVRAARGAYKIGAPGMMYRLSKVGPVGRAASDLIPGVGEFLMYAQGTVAAYDGGKAFHDCVSKVE
jgi:hypothetical protein